jgi:hypothetical protein
LEDTPVKAVFAVVFVLSSLGAPAQALDASTEYCADDFFGGITEQRATPAQIVAAEPASEKVVEAVEPADEADRATITGTIKAADVPVRTTEPGDKAQTAAMSDNKPTVDDTIAPSTMPAQIVTTEPTVAKAVEAVEPADEADRVTVTGTIKAADVPVGTTEPGDKAQTAAVSDNKPAVDDTTAPSTMPARIVTTEPASEKVAEAVDEADRVSITGTINAASVPVRTTEPGDKIQAATASDNKPTAEDTIAPSTIPAQIVTIEPASEKVAEAVDEADRVSITGTIKAADGPVGTTEPGDKTQAAAGSDNKPTVDDTIAPSTMPAQIVTPEPASEKAVEAVDEADRVTITGPNNAADVPVRTAEPGDKTQTTTGSDNKPAAHDTDARSTTPAQIVIPEPASEKVVEAE